MDDMRAETDDNQLALRANEGDEGAFRCLLERHYDFIFKLSFRHLGSKEDAEDLTQDICISLVDKLSSYRAEAKFTTWLYRVVMNQILDHLRKSKRIDHGQKLYGEHLDLTLEENKARKDDQDWLYQTLDHMDFELRETAVLVIAQGYSHKEAGDLMGVKESTVSWRLHELRKKLKQIVELEQ